MDCPTCDGEGELINDEGEDEECPDCEGTGEVDDDDGDDGDS